MLRLAILKHSFSLLSLIALSPSVSATTAAGVVAHPNILRATVKISNSFSGGSGVIVRRDNQSYYVLTAAHVADCALPNREELLVTTSDNKSHIVKPEDISCPQPLTSLSQSLIQCEESKIKSEPWGIDLAVISFLSSDQYASASRTKDIDKPGITVFIGGYPKESSQLTVVKSEGGALVPPKSPASTCQGYGLRYIAATQDGMSGGGVWNENGELVGIHGYRLINRNNNLALARGSYSSGIPIGYWKDMDQPYKVIGIKLIKNSPIQQDNNPADLISQAQNILNRSWTNGSPTIAALSEAATLIQKARSIDQSQPAYPAMEAQIFINIFKQIGDSRLLDQALTLSNLAIRQSRNYRPSYEGLYEKIRAEVHALRGNYAKAIIDVDTRLKMRPNDTSALKDKAQYLFALSDFRGAYQAINQAISLDPDDPAALVDRGLILARAGMTLDACSDWNTAIRKAELQSSRLGAFERDAETERQRAASLKLKEGCR